MRYRLLGMGVLALVVSCGDDDGGAGLTGGSASLGGGGGGTETAGAGGAGGDATAGSSGNPVGGGGGGGTGSSSTSDGGSCERTYVQANHAAPDMMIVMDASGSMVGVSFSGGGGVNRWNPAVQAVNTVVGELESAFKFGLSTYPGLIGGQPGGCQTGAVDVPLAVGNAQPIADHLASVMPATGNTPTSATLAAAQAYLAQQPPTYAGEFALPQYVMLVTDGDPNCVDIQNPISALGGNVDTGARTATLEAINSLATAGVLTYVIGYDTAGTAFASYLDELAVAGSTGDTMHRSVTSGDQLLEEFRRITSGLVSCNFVLATPADFSRVNVYLDAQNTTYGEDWVLREDGQTVELIGAACDALQSGATLEAEVVCEVVNII